MNTDNFTTADWSRISQFEKLSEEFIRENSEKVHWYWISQYQKLSEDFIRENSERVDWGLISQYQKLSEEFIREFSDKVNWYNISTFQKLSEEFIRENSERVNWGCISVYQKLSEEFIRENSDKVNWDNVYTYQKLGEGFIRENSNKVNWNNVSEYQKLSEGFIKEYKLTIPDTCWLYKTTQEIEEYIKNNTNYEIIDGEVIAYKSCRLDGYSKYNFQYKYEVGGMYESHADANIDNENSFGISAWTKEKAIEYCGEKLFKVGIKVEDIAAIVHDGGKIRARKIRIIEEVLP